MQGRHFLGYVAQYYAPAVRFFRRCDSCGGDHDSVTRIIGERPIAYSILAREARSYVGTSDGRGKDHQVSDNSDCFCPRLGEGRKAGRKRCLDGKVQHSIHTRYTHSLHREGAQTGGLCLLAVVIL